MTIMVRRRFVFVLLALCMSEKVFNVHAASEDSRAVDLNAAAATVKSKLSIVSSELAAETKAENDQLAAVRKEILDLTKNNFELDKAVRKADTERSHARERIQTLIKDKRKCDDAQERNKKVRQQEFASVSTLRGLIAQVSQVNSSTVLELAGNLTAAELDGSAPVQSSASALSMIQMPTLPFDESGRTALIQRVAQQSLNFVAERHGKQPLQLHLPETATSDLQVGDSVSRPHTQLDDVGKSLKDIEEQLTAEDVALAATCNKLNPALTTARSYLKTKMALWRVAVFKRREADAAIGTRQKVASALVLRNTKTQAKRSTEQQTLKRILKSMDSLALGSPTQGVTVPPVSAAEGKSVMNYVSYMFDEMASTLNGQLSTLKATVDDAIAKMSVAAADEATKKKTVENLQLGLLDKQKAFDGKQSAYNHAATAETEGIKKLAESTNKIDKLQVMVNDMLWATSSIPRDMLLNISDPLKSELSGIEEKKAKLKASVKAAEDAMDMAEASLKADEQKLAEAQQDVKEAEEEVRLLDKEKQKLAEQLKTQEAAIKSQMKVLTDLKTLTSSYVASV